MPFPVILRSTLFFSSILAASSYALYQNNPQFRNFIDNTVNRITTAWDDILASLSPEERQRQRNAQRQELALAIEARKDTNSSNDKQPADASTSSRARPANEAKARRRLLWEVAEKNAERLKTGTEGAQSGRDASEVYSKSSDSVVRGLADAASNDSSLKILMQDVAAGRATYAQLSSFQNIIEGLKVATHSPSQIPVAYASVKEPDPVLKLLVQDAGTDSELRKLMEVVSSGQANDQQLEAFAERIHALDSTALGRNDVNMRMGSAPPPYEAQEMREQPTKITKDHTVLFEQGPAERGSSASAAPMAPDPEEDDIEIASSRFQSATMSHVFPELTIPTSSTTQSRTRNLATVPGPIDFKDEDDDDDEEDEYVKMLTPRSPSLESASDGDTGTNTDPLSHISDDASDADADDAMSIHSDAPSTVSDASWVTGVSGVSGASGWAGMEHPGEVAHEA